VSRAAGAAEDDLAEALEALGRLRRAVAGLAAEAEDRRRRAACQAACLAGGPLHPRAQGLQDAAAFHAARLADGRRRLAAAEAQVAALRRAARRPGADGQAVRPCG